VRYRTFSQPLFISLMIAALPVCAQEASTATPPPTSTSATTTPAPASSPAPAASADEDLKKAKANGLHAETRKGATVYCYEDATIGTRFTTKKCVNGGAQLDALIAQRQAAKDSNLQRPMTGTGSR
jgi:hypothetical protein